MTPRRRTRQAGFSLVEVMIALAILGLGLTILIGSLAASSRQAPEVQLMSAATSLARGKMLDVEEQLMKDGFMESDQSSEGDFDAEGWPTITWAAKVEQVELPSLDAIQAMEQQAMAEAEAAASGSGSGLGSGSGGPSGSGNLIGMLSMMGGMGLGGAGDGLDPSAASSGVSAIYPQLQEIFKASLRRVTLTVKWQVAGNDRSFDTVAFFTDPAGMTKTLGQLGQGPPKGDP